MDGHLFDELRLARSQIEQISRARVHSCGTDCSEGGCDFDLGGFVEVVDRVLSDRPRCPSCGQDEPAHLSYDAGGSPYFDCPSLDMFMPHCDQRVLHAPGECRFCDDCPEWQRLRVVWGIAFTGHEPGEDQVRCPSRREVETINRWPGNRAAS